MNFDDHSVQSVCRPMQDQAQKVTSAGRASISAKVTDGVPCWYAVFCKPRQETVAKENLQRQGFDAYLPRFTGRQWRMNRWVDSLQVLFPRYLFVRIDRRRQSMASIRSTRGVVDLVRFGVEPAVVPEAVIDAIHACEDAATGTQYPAQRRFREGDLVTLLDGPFAGLAGIFASDDGNERAILLIDLLGKTNRVRVNRDWIILAA